MAVKLKTQKDLHLQRKLFHVSGVMTAFVLMNYLNEKQSWIVYCLVGVPFILWDFGRQHIKVLNDITLKYFRPILRASEAQSFSGVTFALLGVGISFFLFHKPVVLLAVLFLAIGDPVASFFGLLYGQDKIIGRKSLQGSLAAFIFCSIAGYIYFFTKGIMLDHIILVSFLGGFIAAFAELLPVSRLDDNFTQILISSSLLTILFSLFGGF